MGSHNSRTANKSPLSYSVVLKGHSFPGSKYSNQKRIEAVVFFMLHGSLTKTSKACGIPLTTLHDWRHSEWWPELSKQVRIEKESEFQAGLSRIVTSALGEIEDRLENGDVRLVANQSSSGCNQHQRYQDRPILHGFGKNTIGVLITASRCE